MKRCDNWVIKIWMHLTLLSVDKLASFDDTLVRNSHVTKEARTLYKD